MRHDGLDAARDLLQGLLREDPNDGRPLIGLGEAAAVKAVYRGERRISMHRMTAGAETAGRSGRARGATAVSVWGWKQQMPLYMRLCALGAANAQQSSACRPTSSSTMPPCRLSHVSGLPAPTS